MIWFKTFVAIAVLSLTSCVSTPSEIVDLSNQMGTDIQKIYSSYDLLITEYYKGLRAERIDYLDNVWTPIFLKKWVNEGELIEVAKGNLYWSDAKDDFAELSDNDSSKTFNTISMWTSSAIDQIENKRAELIDPLTESERVLRAELQESLNTLTMANATITAHLLSLRKVSDAQNDLLKSFRLEGVDVNLTSALLEASTIANKGLEEIIKADGYIDAAGKIIGGIK